LTERSTHGVVNLGTSIVQVVVVDVELRVGVGSASSAEGEVDELFTKNSVEDAVTEVTVVFEDLVDDVPSVDLALVSASNAVDVVLHDLGQGVTVTDA
jgi:hypothetical protein